MEYTKITLENKDGIYYLGFGKYEDKSMTVIYKETLEELNTMADEDIRSESRDQLIANKGSASMHEWIISLLDENTLPSPLGNIVDLVSAYVSGVCELGVCSLVV